MNLNNLMTNALLGQLKNVNPNGYQELMNYMNSGKDPNTILNELLASGRFTQADIEKAKSMMSNNQGGNIKRF